MIRATFSITTEKFAHSFEPTTQFDVRCVVYATLRFALKFSRSPRTHCLATRRLRVAHVGVAPRIPYASALLRRRRQIFKRSRQAANESGRFIRHFHGAPEIILQHPGNETRPKADTAGF